MNMNQGGMTQATEHIVKGWIAMRNDETASLVGKVGLNEIGNPYLTISETMLGDILIAEPKATIGFAGARVIQQTIGESLPEGFQTSEYVREHGGIDLVVSRKNLRDTIGTLLSIFLKKKESEINTEDDNINIIGKDIQKTSKAI